MVRPAPRSRSIGWEDGAMAGAVAPAGAAPGWAWRGGERGRKAADEGRGRKPSVRNRRLVGETGSKPVGGDGMAGDRHGVRRTGQTERGRLQRMEDGNGCRARLGWARKPPVRNRRLAGKSGSQPVGMDAAGAIVRFRAAFAWQRLRFRQRAAIAARSHWRRMQSSGRAAARRVCARFRFAQDDDLDDSNPILQHRQILTNGLQSFRICCRKHFIPVQ